MPPDVVARAFDPFFTTKPLGQGTGLGLSMIYGFVKQSGGQVRIHSTQGMGTTVTLYLPRFRGQAEADEVSADLAAVPRADAGETVLVVDDESTIRMLLTEVLEDLGYAAVEAADGASSLKVLLSDIRIDLLVTDVGLPGGMNGRQMADAARFCAPGPEGAVHHGVCRGRRPGRERSRQWHAGHDEAVRHGGAGAAHPFHDHCLSPARTAVRAGRCRSNRGTARIRTARAHGPSRAPGRRPPGPARLRGRRLGAQTIPRSRSRAAARGARCVPGRTIDRQELLDRDLGRDAS